MKNKVPMNTFFILLFLLNTVKILGGGIFTIEETRRNKTILSKTYIEKHLLRIESNIDGEMYISIYNSEKEILYNIDIQKQTYTVITKSDLEKIGGRMKSANKLIEEKMKELPEDQRQLMMNMMKQKLEPQDIPKDKIYSRVGTGEKVGTWICDKYQLIQDDELMREIWVTDWDNVGLKENYKNVLKSIETFFNYFTDQLSSQVKSQSLNLDFSLADKGIPVKTVYYINDSINGTSVIKEITETELPITLFVVPTDFKRENLFETNDKLDH